MSDFKKKHSHLKLLLNQLQSLFGKNQVVHPYNPKEIIGNEALLKQIIRIAQHESELELGVNPSDFEQAQTSYLTEADFEYISRVCALVEKRLKNEDWLAKTINNIQGTGIKPVPIRGIRFDDELFKAGRGILESFIREKYHKEK